jgi:hypothetical protein
MDFKDAGLNTPICPSDLFPKPPAISRSIIEYINISIRNQILSPNCKYAKITVNELTNYFTEFQYGQMEHIKELYAKSGWRVDFVNIGRNPLEYFLLFVDPKFSH